MSTSGKKKTYKYCFVPRCYNTTTSTPDKAFVHVARDHDVRKKWNFVARRKDELSVKSTMYCCEDHFIVSI